MRICVTAIIKITNEQQESLPSHIKFDINDRVSQRVEIGVQNLELLPVMRKPVVEMSAVQSF